MKNNKLFKKILFTLIFLMMLITPFSIFGINSNAASSNTVYLKDSVVEADASGLVIVEIVGEGQAGDEVSVFIHTEGGTAIPGLDYVNVNTLVRPKYGSDGKLSYKVSIKCLVTPESREKIRTFDQNNIYGRYFKFVIEKANNATVNSEKSIAQCYLPYNFKAEIVTGNTQDTATHFGEAYAYFKDFQYPQTQYNKGKDNIDGKSSWKTWEHGMTFNNDTTANWVNVFINQGIASAYGTYTMRKCACASGWTNDDSTHMYLKYGNKELIEKMNGDYNKNDNCPGTALYVKATTRSFEQKFFWSDIDYKAEEIQPKTIKQIIIDKTNPYDDDDETLNVDDISVKTEARTIRWYQQTDEWFANKNSFITAGAVKIEPYNGVLDTGLSVYNDNKEYDIEVRYVHEYLALVDSTTPQVVGEFIDDSELSTTGKLKMYIRFNEPVMMARTDSGSNHLTVTFNNSTSNYVYANYLEGNYTDTLVYEVDPPQENIRDVKYQFPTDNIGDLAYNLDEFKVVNNNRLTKEFTDQERNITFLNGAVNLLKPTIALDDNSQESSSSPHNIYNLLISINNNGQKELKEGKLYYTIDKNEALLKEDGTAYTSVELANAELYKNVHEFAPEENGSFTITLVKNEAEGIDSGTYYLHAYAVSDYGLTDVKTFGPYNLDGDPPLANQMHPDPNDLINKTFILDLTNKATAVDNVFVRLKYTDKNGAAQQNLIQIIKNGKKVEALQDKIVIEENEANTIYKYSSNINDADIQKILNDNGFSRIEFDAEFYIEDVAGNKTTTNSIKVIFDSRDLFKTTLNMPIADTDKKGYTLINDINVSADVLDKSTIGENPSEKDIYIDVADVSENTDARADITNGAVFSVLINGKTKIEAGEDKFRVTLTNLEPGFYDIVPMITGTVGETKVDRVANNIKFYITNNKQDNNINKEKILTDLVLSNKVFQLQDQRYYYLDEGGSTVISYPYGATYDAELNKAEGGSTYPSFSNVNEAKKYVKFMEYQDLHLTKLTPSLASLLNSGSTSTSFVKASGETVTAQEGQLWIRYKKNTWENTASAFGWAYYYYGNGKLEDGININALPTNLSNAMTEVVNRITNAGKTIYLVEEATLNQRTGAPYLASTQIHAAQEVATKNMIGLTNFASEAKYDGDKDIYKNVVKIKIGDETHEYALATNLEIKVNDSTRLFYRYSPTDDPNNTTWKEINATDGMKLSELLPNQSSGPYLLREYGDLGVSEYYIYYDKSIPAIDVVIGDKPMTLDGSVVNFSSDTFIIKGFTTSTNYQQEVDDLAYIAIFSYPNKDLIEVLYASDFIDETGNRIKDRKLEEKNYYIQVGDRSGNIATYTVLLSNSALVVEAKENDSKTSVIVKVYDRDESEIYSYEVYCNEVLVTTEYAETKMFNEPGIYRIKVVDIYGNEVNETAEFAFKIPEIIWYYSGSDETYSKYDPNNIVSMTMLDDPNNSRITNVYTSRMIRFQFVTEYGEDQVQFEILDLNSGDYSYSDATSTVSINRLASFRLRVWYESLPQNDHTFIVKVDNEAPSVYASFVGNSFVQYIELDAEGNVIKTSAFDKIDLTNINENDRVTVDTLAYSTSSESEKVFEDGAVINGGHIVIKFADPSKIKKFTISRNGQPISMDLDNEEKLIINSFGYYEITVSDMLGNIKRFTFTNTNEPITKATIDDLELVNNEKAYGNDNIVLKYLYPGEHRVLVETPSGKETIIFKYDGEVIKYGYYVCVIEKTRDENNQIIETKVAEFVESEDFSLNLEDTNINEKTWYKALETDYYVISFMIEEKMPIFKFEIKEIEDSEQPLINVEMLYNAGNTVFPSYYLASLSKEQPEVKIFSGDMEVEIKDESKYIYISGILNIDPKVNPNITTISFGYSENSTIDKLTVVYENGAFKKALLGINEGFYKISVTNIFNITKEYIICKVDSFKTIVNAIYVDGSSTEFLSSENVIYSNSRIVFNVYNNEGASFEIDGSEYAGVYEGGVTVLEVYMQGDHTVAVIGSNDVREEYKISIMSDSSFLYDEAWLTGYTENALLKDQGYTSTPLTVVKAEGVEYIAYKYGENDLKVLYDNISENKIVDEDSLFSSIGNDGNGDYIVYFKNKYGDLGTKTIHFSNTPALVLSRKTVAENNAFATYDLNMALEQNFYSNYVLKFETTSIRYEFKIDDAIVSLDEPKILEFSNSSGNGSFGYNISYLDEYGNYLEFRAELYRADVTIDTSLMKEIIVGNDTYTKNNIIIMFGDELTGFVSVDNGDRVPYKSGSTFYKDGRYEFIVEDIAGNRCTYVINHKSINHYTLTNTVTQTEIIMGSVINNSSVTFEATDESKIVKVFKNSNLVSDYESNQFTTTGHWELIIEDLVGNQSYAGFYIINNPLISFEYQAPFDYVITEIWHTLLNGQRQTIEAEEGKPIVLTENGDYAVVVSSINSTTSFNFSVTINDTPPTATLSGVEDGGVTSRNVSIKGLKSGDVVEIYKNGELVTTTDVSLSNAAPEITTGGNYRIVIKAVSGAEVEYNFTRKQIANAATSTFIVIACMVVIAGIGIGLLYHTRVKNDSNK